MSSASQNTSGRKPYYILRHVHTGNLMPQRISGKGYTHTEPEDTGIPRLFLTARGAKCCPPYGNVEPKHATTTNMEIKTGPQSMCPVAASITG